MNKKKLISKIVDVLKENEIRKVVNTPRHVFHISDDDGNQKDFIVRKTDRSLLYNLYDVGVIIDGCISVIEDAIKHGESVNIHGFGSLSVFQRKASRTRHPVTGEKIEVSSRYTPKFSFGNDLRKAARLYELSLSDRIDDTETIPESEYVDGGDI